MRLGLGIGLQFGHRSGGAAQGPSNTVAPAVTGTAERGELLTCSTGTWTGTGSITYAYQWRRNGAPIAGATSNTYTLVAADDNATITCIVTATDDTGSRAASSNAVGPVLGAPFNLVAPVLTGTEAVGQTLSVTTGTWQGVATITFAYQWRRDGSNISGATSSTYTLVAADYDAVIDCVVTATNSLDSASADSNDTGAIAGLAPANDVAPSISGDTGLGDVLTRVAGTWSGVPTPTLSGQWRRNGVAIPGETGTTYTIVAADSGAAIDYLETATNAEGSATADSNDITVQTFTVPTNDVAPSISGNTGLGDTLTRTAGTWSGNPTPVLTGQWRRNGTPISGETGTTYTIAVADSGADIDYLETATNAIGSASADSNDITAQTFAAPTIGAGLSIAGTEEVGETLTATAASVTGNPTPTRTWQWQRSADGSTGWADISGATSSTYVLDAADEGNFVRVKQIETNALGFDEAVSAASGEIQAGGATGLLDSYKGSAFAMSPDTLLYGSYSATDDVAGSVTNGDSGQFSVAILRDSDNAVRSFTPAEVADGTANTWVQAGVGGAANGFVRRGYDQSVTALNVSNLNHGDQSDPTKMPKLFDSSTGLILENGKAAMDFDSDYLEIQNSTSTYKFIHDGTESTIVSVCQFGKSSNPNAGYALMGNNAVATSKKGFFIIYDDRNGIATDAYKIDITYGAAGAQTARIIENNYIPPNQQVLLFNEFDADNANLSDRINVYRNNANLAEAIGTLRPVTTDDATHNLQIGAHGNNGFLMTGFIQMLWIDASNQSTNRTAISGLINTEYNNIY